MAEDRLGALDFANLLPPDDGGTGFDPPFEEINVAQQAYGVGGKSYPISRGIVEEQLQPQMVLGIMTVDGKVSKILAHRKGELVRHCRSMLRSAQLKVGASLRGAESKSIACLPSSGLAEQDNGFLAAKAPPFAGGRDIQ